MKKGTRINIIMAAAVIPMFLLNLIIGSVDIPLTDVVAILFGKDCAQASWEYIILQTRLPQAITAVLCGSSLAVSGLLLQTAFRNPLAGPSIFGINSGASLGAALVMLAFGGGITLGTVSLTGFVAVLVAAFIGAGAVMAVLLLFAGMVRNNVMLLIIGIMIGYIASSAIALLNFFRHRRGSTFIHGMGSRQLRGRVNAPDSVVRHGNGCRSQPVNIAHKTAQHAASRRTIRRKPWHKHTAPAQQSACYHGYTDSLGHGILRPNSVHRACRSAHSAHDSQHRRP